MHVIQRPYKTCYYIDTFLQYVNRIYCTMYQSCFPCIFQNHTCIQTSLVDFCVDSFRGTAGSSMTNIDKSHDLHAINDSCSGQLKWTVNKKPKKPDRTWSRIRSEKEIQKCKSPSKKQKLDASFGSHCVITSVSDSDNEFSDDLPELENVALPIDIQTKEPIYDEVRKDKLSDRNSSNNVTILRENTNLGKFNPQISKCTGSDPILISPEKTFSVSLLDEQLDNKKRNLLKSRESEKSICKPSAGLPSNQNELFSKLQCETLGSSSFHSISNLSSSDIDPANLQSRENEENQSNPIQAQKQEKKLPTINWKNCLTPSKKAKLSKIIQNEMERTSNSPSRSLSDSGSQEGDSKLPINPKSSGDSEERHFLDSLSSPEKGKCSLPLQEGQNTTIQNANISKSSQNPNCDTANSCSVLRSKALFHVNSSSFIKSGSEVPGKNAGEIDNKLNSNDKKFYTDASRSRTLDRTSQHRSSHSGDAKSPQHRHHSKSESSSGSHHRSRHSTSSKTHSSSSRVKSTTESGSHSRHSSRHHSSSRTHSKQMSSSEEKYSSSSRETPSSDSDRKESSGKDQHHSSNSHRKHSSDSHRKHSSNSLRKHSSDSHRKHSSGSRNKQSSDSDEKCISRSSGDRKHLPDNERKHSSSSDRRILSDTSKCEGSSSGGQTTSSKYEKHHIDKTQSSTQSKLKEKEKIVAKCSSSKSAFSGSKQAVDMSGTFSSDERSASTNKHLMSANKRKYSDGIKNKVEIGNVDNNIGQSEENSADMEILESETICGKVKLDCPDTTSAVDSRLEKCTLNTADSLNNNGGRRQKMQGRKVWNSKSKKLSDIRSFFSVSEVKAPDMFIDQFTRKIYPHYPLDIDALSSNFTQLQINTIDSCFEEGLDFLDHAIAFINDFSGKYRPSSAVINKLVEVGLKQTEKIHLIFKSFETLLYVNRRHPGSVVIDWELISETMSGIDSGRTVLSQTVPTLVRASLCLQLSIVSLHDDLFGRDISDPKNIRRSMAYKFLSYDTGSSNLKQIVTWLSLTLTSGEFEEVRESYLRLQLEDCNGNEAVNGNGPNLEENLISSEVKKILPLLQKLLELGIQVSSSNMDASKFIASEVLRTYIYLPHLCHKKLLLQTMHSELLKFRLIQLILENHCDQALPCCDTFPESLRIIKQCYYECLPPRNLLTPPTTPQSLDGDNGDEGQLQAWFSPASCEELVMLLYYLTQSFVCCSRSRYTNV